MANDITNVVTIRGDDRAIAELFALHVVDGKKGPRFDLGTIVPVPKCVEDTYAPTPWDPPSDLPKYPGDLMVEELAEILLMDAAWMRPAPRHPWLPTSVRSMSDLREWIENEHTGALFWARRRLKCAAETGCPGWYTWNYANWGCRGNTYDFGLRERSNGLLVIAFDTANAPPRPALQKLSEMHPSLALDVESVDEGGPEYAGRYAGGEGALERVAEDADRYRRVMQREPYSDDDGAGA